MRIKSLIIVTLLIITPFSTVFSAEKIKITNAWVSEAPPMAKSMAAYMEIKNMTDKSVMLRSITSNNFERSMIHKTEIQNGMAKMSPVSHLVIKPNETIRFEPGKYHLMLVNPQKVLKAGDKVDLTLQFTNDLKMTVKASVKKMSHTEGHSNHEKHDDVKMDDHHDDRDMHEDREEMKHDQMPHTH